jgi:hypothetical protein
MRVASGYVVHGKVELEENELPEGAAVAVIFPEDEDSFEVDAELEGVLLESLAQCERGETIPLETLLDELRRRG